MCGSGERGMAGSSSDHGTGWNAQNRAKSCTESSFRAPFFDTTPFFRHVLFLGTFRSLARRPFTPLVFRSVSTRIQARWKRAFQFDSATWTRPRRPLIDCLYQGLDFDSRAGQFYRIQPPRQRDTSEPATFPPW